MRSQDLQSKAPNLTRALAKLAARLRRAALWQGLGIVLTGATLFGIFAFLSDYALQVPKPIRLLLLIAWIGITGYLAWRFVRGPLSRIPGWAGLAVLAERDVPESAELLISGVEFATGTDGAEADAKPLEQRVIQGADQQASAVDPARIVDLRRPLGWLGAGTLAAGGFALWLASHPTHSSTFFNRILGGTRPWPKRTELVLDVRVAEGQAQIDRSDPDVLRVAVARGQDVPIVVEARGVVPNSVLLHLSSVGQDARKLPLAASAGGNFSTVLQSLREGVRLHATGGDDRDAIPRVEIEVLTPPDVVELAMVLQPPDYSGLPTEVVSGGDARALRGTQVRVVALPSTPTVQGSALLLPEGREIPLVPMPLPSAEESPGGEPREGLGFDWVLEESLRYRIELIDERGLENPNPGLRVIEVLEDRAPEITLLSPGRSDVETIVGGRLPLVAQVRDDYGLREVRYGVREAGGEGASFDAQLELLVDPTLASTTERAGRIQVGLEVDQLLVGLQTPVTNSTIDSAAESDGQPTIDQNRAIGTQLEIRLSADDNATQPQTEQSPIVRVRVLGADELLRRLQDRLAKARLEAAELFEEARDARTETDDLLTSLTGEGAGEPPSSRSLRGALGGQRRVATDAEALLRELSGVTESLLYARLDPAADDYLTQLERSSLARTTRLFDPGPWRSLTSSVKLAEVPSSGLAGHLLGIVGLAIEVSEEGAAPAVDGLDRALDSATDPEGLLAALVQTRESQTATLASLEALLERLKEWDNFQSVLTLTRDILSRQKALQERTKRYASK